MKDFQQWKGCQRDEGWKELSLHSRKSRWKYLPGPPSAQQINNPLHSCLRLEVLACTPLVCQSTWPNRARPCCMKGRGILPQLYQPCLIPTVEVPVDQNLRTPFSPQGAKTSAVSLNTTMGCLCDFLPQNIRSLRNSPHPTPELDGHTALTGGHP